MKGSRYNGTVKNGTGFMHFLVVYDREAEALVRFEAFPSHEEALEARFQEEREREFTGRFEIVVIGGRDESAIRANHAQYFQSVEEIIDDFVKHLGER